MFWRSIVSNTCPETSAYLVHVLRVFNVDRAIHEQFISS